MYHEFGEGIFVVQRPSSCSQHFVHDIWLDKQHDLHLKCQLGFGNAHVGTNRAVM